MITLAAASSACVMQPVAPSAPPPPQQPETRVFFYPTRGQSAEQQDRDKFECHGWAVQQSKFDPSAPNVPPHLHFVVSSEPPSGAGIATGAVAGAVLGAAVSRPWQAGPGALAGAVTGAIIGGIAESAAAQRAREQAVANAEYARDAQLEEGARRYRRALTACLAGRGYEVR